MKRVCVFCGSNPGIRPEYVEAARALAAEVARRGMGLVYGGAAVGVMGALADAALREGGEIIGVIPRGLAAREIAHTGLTELRQVDSMHERKAMMASLADGFIALPGGLGTLDETFEVLTWAQLGIHRKPVGILDVAGYYDGLRRFLTHAVEEGLLRREHFALLLFSGGAGALLDLMESWRSPAHLRAWLDAVQT